MTFEPSAGTGAGRAYGEGREMARSSAKKGSCEERALWRDMVAAPSQVDELDKEGREHAWQALVWAHAHEKIQPLPLPVAADACETSAVLRVTLSLMSAPPSGAPLLERLGVAEWAAALRYPQLEIVRGKLLAEAGRLKEAILLFDGLKSAASVFPEVPFLAGCTLLAHAGADSKLLHKAETWLLHAEHLAMDGSEEVEDEDEWQGDTEDVAPDVALDEFSQQRLAEIWALMAKLYARLGDPKKAEMYRQRAGSVCEETAEEATPEGLEPLEGELPDPTVLKPADRTLIRRFLESPQFSALSPAQQRQASVALPSFVSLGRLYLGLAPTRLDRYSLEELMLGLIPEKLVATLDEMGNVPAALIAWIHFLGKGGQMRDGARLVGMVGKLTGEMLSNCRNPDKWSMAKTLAMQMVATGVDLDDQAAVSRFLANRSARLLAV